MLMCLRVGFSEVKNLVAICRFDETLDGSGPCPEGGNNPFQLRLPVWLIHNEAGAPDRSLRKLAEKLHQPCFGLAMPQDCSNLQCLDDLASAYVECVRAHQPAGPYVLVGCSVLGSLLAAAMTSHLERCVHLKTLRLLCPALLCSWLLEPSAVIVCLHTVHLVMCFRLLSLSFSTHTSVHTI